MSKTLDIEIGQFLLDTMAMRPEIVGAYVRLMVAYRNTGPLDINKLQRLSGLDDMDWEFAEEQIAPLFEPKEGFWHHAAIDEQIAKHGRLRKNAAKASAAAQNKPAPESGIIAQQEVIEQLRQRQPDPEPRRAPPPEPEPELHELKTGPKVQTQVMHVGASPPDEIGDPLPHNWTLSGEQINQARGEGYSSDIIADVLDSFRRYHMAAGTLSTDWSASWAKWWERKKPSKPKPRVQVSRKADDANSEA